MNYEEMSDSGRRRFTVEELDAMFWQVTEEIERGRDSSPFGPALTSTQQAHAGLRSAYINKYGADFESRFAALLAVEQKP